MGVLDEAIREHLELKRRHGADPGEVAHLERRALGPVDAIESDPHAIEADAIEADAIEADAIEANATERDPHAIEADAIEADPPPASGRSRVQEETVEIEMSELLGSVDGDDDRQPPDSPQPDSRERRDGKARRLVGRFPSRR